MLVVADLIALLHGLFVVYIGGGVVAILLGRWRNWAWTRAFWFRFTHLLICTIVLLFEVANQPCPLTVLERQARAAAGATAYEGGFIAHYVSRTIHLDVPPWVLSGPTFLLAAVVLWRYWIDVSRAVPGNPAGQAGGPQSASARETPEAERDPTRTPGLPSRRGAIEYLLLVVLLAVVLPFADLGLERVLPGWHSSDAGIVAFFLVLCLALCLPDRRASGLRLGETARWRAKDLWILFFWSIPPLATILVYGQLADRPYHGKIDWPCWLLGSAAQELLFFGFVYGRLAGYWGEGPEGWRGMLGRPVLLSALLFALWHVQNVRTLDPGYVAFQTVYAFLGAAWCLQMRRWTGSLLPGLTNHVVVNYLASVL